MSRSYKKSPYVTDHHRKSSKINKRIANHSFRQRLNEFDEDMPARPQHRKYTESYNICDYKFRMSREEAVKWYEKRIKDDSLRGDYVRRRFPTLESWLNYWEKCYRRK